MTKNKRFELKSFHYHDLKGVIYDNLKEEELHLSLYEIVNLLNEVSQDDYDLQKIGKEISNKIDEIWKSKKTVQEIIKRRS